MKFNSQQEKAYLEESNCCLVSTAGSGKTAVITHKAKRILDQSPGNRVVLVTFTRASANALLERILKIDPGLESRVVVGTFHSLAIQQIARSASSLNLLGQFERESLIKQAQQTCAKGFALEEVTEAIENAQSGKLGLLRKNPSLNEAYEYFLQGLEKHNAMDLNSVIGLAVDQMKSGNTTALQATHIFVDEFQDIDNIQLRWLYCQMDAGLTAMVVGDDDQSIYGFRRSMGFAAFKDLAKRYKAKKLMMERNYRCAPNILSLAEVLINHNKERISKTLVADKKKNGFISYEVFEWEEDESDCIINYAREKPEDWAVIARTNSRIDKIVLELVIHNIPYTRIGEKSFWDLPLPSVILAICKHCVDYNLIGLESVMSYLGFPSLVVSLYHDFRKKTAKGRLTGEFLIRARKLIPASANLTAEDVVKFDVAITRFAREYNEDGVEVMLQSLQEWLCVMEKKLTPADKANQYFKKERMIMSSIESIASQEGSLKQRVIKLLQMKNKSDRGVKLMTAHGSKGLEFKNVFVVGVEDDMYPHKKLANSIEEERRLLFVAMTRAEETLILTSIINPDRKFPKYPSTFLRELGFDPEEKYEELKAKQKA